VVAAFRHSYHLSVDFQMKLFIR